MFTASGALAAPTSAVKLLTSFIDCMGTFNELRDISEYKPRLFTKPEGTTEIGCLRFSFKGRDYEYEIGPTHLRPFRLMRCLFSPSPRHVDTLASCSVMQTQERVYA